VSTLYGRGGGELTGRARAAQAHLDAHRRQMENLRAQQASVANPLMFPAGGLGGAALGGTHLSLYLHLTRELEEGMLVRPLEPLP
jgi:hypothetical protein